MADDILQVFREGRVDAKTLSDFMSKKANETIDRRLAPSIRPFQYYLDYWDTVPSIVNDAINNTAVDGGVLADTFVTATAYHPDTYARTQRNIRADTVSLLDFIPIALHEGIKTYTYEDDVAPYIQKAFDYCTMYNKELYCPAGGYMLDPATQNNVGAYLINNWGAHRNLIVRGAGVGVTIFKEKDGATTFGGRYTKLFYGELGLAGFAGDFGNVKFSDMTFDKNGVSNTNPFRQAKIDAGEPVTSAELYLYEQAGVFSFAGAGTVNLKSVHLENIEVRDRVGKGISMASSPNIRVGTVTCINVTSIDHPKLTIGGGDGTFGARGDLEFGMNIINVNIVNPNILYAQIEPVIPSSPTLRRASSVLGGSIEYFEWTDKGGYSAASITNLSSNSKFLTRGIDVNVTNSTIKVDSVFSEGTVKISNSKILLPYDEATNTVSPLSFATVSGYTAYGEMWLNNVDIVIDNPDPALQPSGAGVGGGTGAAGSRKTYLNHVRFDRRLEMSIDAYGNGDWDVANCDLHGVSETILLGGIGDNRGGNINLRDNNFLSGTYKVKLRASGTQWSLKVTGTYPLTNFFTVVGVVPFDDMILQHPILTSPTKPSKQVAAIGQTVINTVPVAGGYERWVKVDTPYSVGSWKGVGLIEATEVAITSGTTAQRPTGVDIGFTYFDTTLGKPVYFKSEGVWVDSAGVTV